MTSKKELSLLPEAENPNSFSSRLLKWLTTIGRIVIIVTELFVIGAFVSRFWLDRRNADLSEVIRQQQAILTSTKEFEKEYTSVQQKLVTIKDLYAKQPEYDSKILSLTESTPPDIVFDNLTIMKDETNNTTGTLNATAYREESIVDYIVNLMLNENIKSISVSKIEKKERENKYTINLKLVFKSDKKI